MTDEPAALTGDEAAAMLIRLGTKLIAALQTSVLLGHSRVQNTVRDYYPVSDCPPADDNDAAVQVVVEVLRNNSRPEEILQRHPWLSMVVEPAGAVVERSLTEAAS